MMRDGWRMHAPAPKNAGAGATPSRQPALGIGFSSASSEHQQPQRRCRQDIRDHRTGVGGVGRRHPHLVVDLDPHADASTALGVSPEDQLDIGRMLKSPRRRTMWFPAAGLNAPGSTAAPAAPPTDAPTVPPTPPPTAPAQHSPAPQLRFSLRLHRHLRPARPGPPRPPQALHGPGRRSELRSHPGRLPPVAERPDQDGVVRQRQGGPGGRTRALLGGRHGTHHARHPAVPAGVRAKVDACRHRGQPGPHRLCRAHVPALGDGVHVRRTAAESTSRSRPTGSRSRAPPTPSTTGPGTRPRTQPRFSMHCCRTCCIPAASSRPARPPQPALGTDRNALRNHTSRNELRPPSLWGRPPSGLYLVR